MTLVGTKEELIAEIERLQKAYHLTFQLNQPANVEVMEDIGRFCRASETCAIPGDHDKTFMLLGRNEVWLRFQQFLNLTPDQLFALYARDASKFRSDNNG